MTEGIAADVVAGVRPALYDFLLLKAAKRFRNGCYAHAVFDRKPADGGQPFSFQHRAVLDPVNNNVFNYFLLLHGFFFASRTVRPPDLLPFFIIPLFIL